MNLIEITVNIYIIKSGTIILTLGNLNIEIKVFRYILSGLPEKYKQICILYLILSILLFRFVIFITVLSKYLEKLYHFTQ